MTSDVLETKASEAVRWSALPERGTLTSLRLLAWIATRIGRWAGGLLLYPITAYFVATACAARRTSYEYLKHCELWA
jgi:predicted LPLAT superfamily acyltransferase